MMMLFALAGYLGTICHFAGYHPFACVFALLKTIAGGVPESDAREIWSALSAVLAVEIGTDVSPSASLLNEI